MISLINKVGPWPKGLCILIASAFIVGITLVAPHEVWSLDVVTTPDGPVFVKTVVAKESRKQEKRIRDPFKWSDEVLQQNESQEVEKKDYFKDFKLSGIIWDVKLPFAVIDDTLLGEGDEIKGVTVKAIFKDEVVLEKDNVYHSLAFEELFNLQGNGDEKDD